MDLRTLKDNATDYFRKGRFAKAAEAYGELCRKEPREAQHRIKLGDSYRRDGRRDMAVEAYRQAALTYAEQGVIIKAIAACKLVLELDPEDREAQESLANLCTKRYVRSSAATATYQPPPRPEVQTPSSRYAPIELPDDDGESGTLVTASGDVIETGADERPLPPLAASRPPPVEEPRIPPPPPVIAPPIPRISPHGGAGLELDLDSGSSARDAAPSWGATRSPIDSGGIELDLGSPSFPETQADPERKRGIAYDLSSLGEPSFPAAHEPELLSAEELEPLEVLDPEELGAELLRPVEPRSSDELALNAAAQSVSDILSDSLLVDGGTDDGYEVELLSVTASVPGWQLASNTPAPTGRTAHAHEFPANDAMSVTGSVTGSDADRDAATSTAARQVPVVFRPVAPSRSEPSAAPGGSEFPGSDVDLLRGAQMANEAFELADPSPLADTPSPAAEVDQSSVPLFSELPREAFLELLQRLTFRRHEPGDVVLREGDSGRSIFVLASGRLRVVKALGERDEVELAILEEGSFFGEMALLNGTPRVASVVAVDECETLEITEELLQELVSRHQAVARSLKKFYRQRLLANVMAMAPIFRSLDRRDRRALLERFKLREVSAGHVVCKEGETNDGLYVVMHGRMRVSRTQEDGTPMTLAVLREGDVFGESSLLARSGANASVASTRKTLLLRLPRSDFNELISTHPTVLEVLSVLADARERETEEIFAGQRPPPDASVA